MEGGNDARQSVSSQERIANLNAIDQDIPDALALASQVIALLPADAPNASDTNLDDVKQKFRDLSAQYAAKLSTIEVKLRREVYALEEAGLIPAGTRLDAAGRATSMNDDQTSKRDGGGSLDNSWLNARAKDSIGRGLKREVIDDAKDFLNQDKIDASEDATGDMQVDKDDG